jgi:hypothetical protein
MTVDCRLPIPGAVEINLKIPSTVVKLGIYK